MPNKLISFFVVKHILACNSINWVSFIVNNIESEWLVDTGASLSAIKLDFLRFSSLCHKIIRDELVVNGVGGSLKAIGYIYLELRYKQYSFKHKFHVFDTLPCKSVGLLGQDFLQRYKGIVDFSVNELSLKNYIGNVISMPLMSYNYSLTIAPRCEMIKYFPVNRTDECVVMRKELCEGVFLASVVAKPENGMIPVRILNTTSEEIVCSIRMWKCIL